jgi:hypothetical protein
MVSTSTATQKLQKIQNKKRDREPSDLGKYACGKTVPEWVHGHPTELTSALSSA